MAQTTLQAIRRAVALQLDDMGQFLITSATTNTVRIANIGTTEANASPNAYDGRWVYCLATGAASGQQRKVNVGGYATNGTLTLDVNWSLVPTANDTAELTGLFPMLAQVGGEEAGYTTLVDRALRKLAYIDEITLATTDGTRRYPSSTWSWLDQPERLLGPLEPDPVGSGALVPADWRGVRLVENAESPMIEIDTPYTGNLTLKVLRPAHTWLSVAGTWQERDGVTNDADIANVSLEDWKTAALVEAFDVLRARSPGRPNGNWSERYEQALAEARSLRHYDTTRFRPQQSAPEAA